MFKDAKVGDRVFDLRKGWGEITKIEECNSFPIAVTFRNRGWETYTFCGRRISEDKHPTLFWSEPEIKAPQRPKRKVRKEVTVFVNITNGGRVWCHDTEGNAKGAVLYPDQYQAVAVPVTGFYEVEE